MRKYFAGPVHAVLPRQGLDCALRTVQRVRRCLGLQIVGPAVRPKCPPRPAAKIKSDGVDDVWCVDIVFDTTQRGTTVKFLALLDEYSHYNLDIVASARMGSREVVAALQSAVARHGAPRHLRCDNCTATAPCFREWTATSAVGSARSCTDVQAKSLRRMCARCAYSKPSLHALRYAPKNPTF